MPNSRTMGTVPDRGIQLGSSVGFRVGDLAEFFLGAERWKEKGEAKGCRERRGRLEAWFLKEVPFNRIRKLEITCNMSLLYTCSAPPHRF